MILDPIANTCPNLSQIGIFSVPWAGTVLQRVSHMYASSDHLEVNSTTASCSTCAALRMTLKYAEVGAPLILHSTLLAVRSKTVFGHVFGPHGETRSGPDTQKLTAAGAVRRRYGPLRVQRTVGIVISTLTFDQFATILRRAVRLRPGRQPCDCGGGLNPGLTSVKGP